MKKIFLLVLCIVFVLCITSCSDAVETTLFTDTHNYTGIWKLPERRVSESSELFPKEIDNFDVSKFLCSHKTESLVGTQWQVELVVRYESNIFLNELERIQKLCEKSPVFGNSKYFNTDTYASVWGWNGCFEYAIVDSTEFSITYIYLQLVNKEVIVDETHLPIDYSMEMNTMEFTVY